MSICGCLPWKLAAGQQQEWHRFWLRFEEERKEAGFLNAQKPFLVRRMQLVAGVGLAINAMAIVMAALFQPPWDAARHHTEMQREVWTATFIVTVLVLPLTVTWFMLGWCAEQVGPAKIEVFAIATLVIFMVATVLGTPANVARFKGIEVSEVLPYSSDSVILLCIDGIMTAAHLGLPVRWFVMLPMQVIGVMLYVVVIAIGGSEPEPYTNCVFLAGLIAVTSIGKRYAELGDREAFLKLIMEKQLRCRAEFQLAQADGKNLSQAVRWNAGVESESAATSKSGTVFSPHDKDLSIRAKLARIAEVGRAERWLIDGKAVKFLHDQVLGRGGFGIVVKAVMSGTLVAVKLSNKAIEDGQVQTFEDLCNEMRVFRHLRHPNIVPFHGAMIDPLVRKIALVMEFVKGVTLETFILKGYREEEQVMPARTVERFQVLLGMSSALLHMHMLKPIVVHSDLKPRNIMVEFCGSEVRPKLLDFGLARVVARSATLRGGTLPFMAPEAWQRRGPAKASVDVYSFGHVITFVSAGLMPPYISRRDRRIGLPPPPLRWPLGCELEPVCRPLAEDCLRFDEAMRPNTREVYRRLLALPERTRLPNASSAFLEGVRVLAEGLQGEAPRDSDGSESAARQSEEVLEVVGGAPRDSGPPGLGSGLPAVPQLEAAPEELLEAPPEDGNREEEKEAEKGGRQEPGDAAAAAAAAAAEMARSPGPPAPPQPLWRSSPRLPATTNLAMLTSALELASLWNLERRRSPCCDLHAAGRAIRDLGAQMEGMACVSDALPRPGWHCPHCALLAAAPGACTYCGMQVRASSALSNEDDAAEQTRMTL